MLYCLRVREDSVNQPERGVEWRRTGGTCRASELRTVGHFFASSGDSTVSDTPPHFSRNSRWLDACPIGPASSPECRHILRSSIAQELQLVYRDSKDGKVSAAGFALESGDRPSHKE